MKNDENLQTLIFIPRNELFSDDSSATATPDYSLLDELYRVDPDSAPFWDQSLFADQKSNPWQNTFAPEPDDCLCIMFTPPKTILEFGQECGSEFAAGTHPASLLMQSKL